MKKYIVALLILILSACYPTHQKLDIPVIENNLDKYFKNIVMITVLSYGYYKINGNSPKNIDDLYEINSYSLYFPQKSAKNDSVMEKTKIYLDVIKASSFQL